LRYAAEPPSVGLTIPSQPRRNHLVRLTRDSQPYRLNSAIAPQLITRRTLLLRRGSKTADRRSDQEDGQRTYYGNQVGVKELAPLTKGVFEFR